MEVGDISPYHVHRCGGEIQVIGFVTIYCADVPEYKCLKCGYVTDASDYEEFEEREDAQS